MLQERSGLSKKNAHKARDALHCLVMAADYRTGEVALSDSKIAHDVLGGDDAKTWRWKKKALVAAGFIRVDAVARNGETDGRLTVVCLAWYSGEYVDAPAAPGDAPRDAPREAPRENLPSLSAPTSGNTSVEVETLRSREENTTTVDDDGDGDDPDVDEIRSMVAWMLLDDICKEIDGEPFEGLPRPVRREAYALVAEVLRTCSPEATRAYMCPPEVVRKKPGLIRMMAKGLAENPPKGQEGEPWYAAG